MRIVFYQIVESVLFALKALRINILRTVLSLLGVTFGILLIIAVFSAVDSLEAELSKSMEIMGDDLVFIQKQPFGPEEGDEEYAWWKYMARPEPTLRDFKILSDRLDVAEYIAFQTGTRKTIQYGNSSADDVFLVGGSFEYNRVFPLKLQSGRYFTELESDGGRNVGLIGFDLSKILFGEEDPLGKEIKVGGSKITIIGKFEKEGATLLQNGFDKVVLVPVTYASRLIDIKNQSNNSITIKPKEGISVQMLKDEVIANFRSVRRLKPKQDNNFSVIEATMISQAVDSLFGALGIVAILMGGFALLVGGFGILNIMFVSVKERTSIIGIQKALGAKNYFILSSFIFESIFLCILGGVIGLLITWLIFTILNAIDLGGFTFILGFGNIVLGLVISSAIGLLAGSIPAYKASRLDPVEAIRS